MTDRRLLMIFVDGLGLRPPAAAGNLILPEICPFLCRMLSQARPIDALLGVGGLPQSATGQTAILTGVNAPQRMGRHVEGFPDARLRAMIREHGIFRHLRAAGISAIFANGYLAENVDSVKQMPRHSATTVAALSGTGHVLTRSDIESRRAVTHDLTRDTLAPRGYRGPLISPEQAAEDLCGIACQHRYTLFEFFLSDRAGHRAESLFAAAILARLDSFLATLLARAENTGITTVMTSDHGNIEDLSHSSHTLNPVPWVVHGTDGDRLQNAVDDLTGIVPAIMEFFSA